MLIIVGVVGLELSAGQTIKPMSEQEASTFLGTLSTKIIPAKGHQVGEFTFDGGWFVRDGINKMTLAYQYIPDLNRLLRMSDKQSIRTILPSVEVAIKAQGSGTNFGKALQMVYEILVKRSSLYAQIADRWEGSQIAEEKISFLSNELECLDERGKDPSWYPTTAALQKKLSDDLKLIDLEIKDLTTSNGGTFSGKIWSAKLNGKTLFFIKISKNKKNEKEAWKKLRDIQRSGVGRLGYLVAHSAKFAQYKSDLPIITSMEKFLTYSYAGKQYVIEVVHAAPGTEAKNVVIGKADPKEYPPDLCAKALGRAFGTLHMLFLNDGWENEHPADIKTVVHGDSHTSNAFVKVTQAGNVKFNFSNKKNNPKNIDVKQFCRVYFIDNETINDSLGVAKRRTLFWDIFQFVLHPVLYWGYLDKRKDIWDKVVAFYTTFVEAYIGVYPVGYQEKLRKFLHKQLYDRLQAAIEIIDDVKKGAKAVSISSQKMHELVKSAYKERDESGSYTEFIDLVKSNAGSIKSLDDFRSRLCDLQSKFKLHSHEIMEMNLADLKRGLKNMQTKIVKLQKKLNALKQKIVV